MEPPAMSEGISRLPTAKVFVAVTVTIPAEMLITELVAELGVGLQVNTNSSLFHHHSNGGLSTVWVTRYALVSAGSRLFPNTIPRANANFFAHSILFAIVYVANAIFSPLQILDKLFQDRNTILYIPESTVTRIAKNPTESISAMAVVSVPR